MNNILETLKPFSKSVAGAIAGAIVLWLAKHNIVIADNLNDAIEVIISAIVTGAVVYFAPKNQPGIK